ITPRFTLAQSRYCGVSTWACGNCAGCGWNATGTWNVNQTMDFSREPRLPVPPVPEGAINVDAPPEVPKSLPANPLARLMPVALLVAAGGMMTLYFTSGGASTTRGPMFMFFPVMMLASVVASFAYGNRGADRMAQLNEDRREYLGYLDALERTVATTAVD